MKLPRIPLFVQLVVLIALFVAVEWLSTTNRRSLTTVLVFWAGYVAVRMFFSARARTSPPR